MNVTNTHSEVRTHTHKQMPHLAIAVMQPKFFKILTADRVNMVIVYHPTKF